MGQIMRWFPVIERLIAILNRSKQGSNYSGGEKDVERCDGLDRIRALSPIIHSRVSNSHVPQPMARVKTKCNRKKASNALLLRMARGWVLELPLSWRRVWRHGYEQQ